MTYLSGNICCLQQWFLELWFMSTGWLEFIKTERYEKCHKVNGKKKKKKCLCYVFSSLPVVVGDTTNAWTNTPGIIKGI